MYETAPCGPSGAVLRESRFGTAPRIGEKSIGMLREQTFGLEKLFVNVKLLDLLTRDDDGVDSQSP